MHTARPSLVLAAVLASATLSTGCRDSGNCGDMSYEDRASEFRKPLNEDGLVETYDGEQLDPLTDEGCEAICRDWSSGIEEVHSCEATVLLPDDDEVGDTGLGEFGVAEVLCVASGEDVCFGGRHSATLARRAHGHGVDFVAAWLAREACGEAGSVLAFARLAEELTAHGAPAELVALARQAEADEVRHARMVGALATRRGGVPDPVEAAPLPPRGLFEIALENAVEGCVHETFAAARAGWQALHATDAEVAAVSRVLAEDEGRHADLAAAVHAWALSVLPPEQAEQVEAARRQAWARLAENGPAVDASAVAVLGLPSPANHARLARAVAAVLAA